MGEIPFLNKNNSHEGKLFASVSLAFCFNRGYVAWKDSAANLKNEGTGLKKKTHMLRGCGLERRAVSFVSIVE